MAKEITENEPFMTDERLDSVAIIMDGNGSWAKSRLLPRTAGHKVGAENIRRVLKVFREIGVHTVTLYAFSTENWSRPKEEVDAIMALADKYLDEVKKQMQEDDAFAMRFIGDKNGLPENVRQKCIEVEAMGDGRPFVCNVALNYGGQDEILHAVNEAIAAGEVPVTKEIIRKHLFTYPTPDPDLLIRTAGDLRISNFLLWQCAYTEFYFTKTYWPDFGRDDIMEAVREFYKRKRRFGGLNPEDQNPA